MAGTIITDKIQTENAFLTLNVGQTLVATINSSGILNSSGGIMISANGAVSNTAITGNITSSQITSNPTFYGNVSVTGTLEATSVNASLASTFKNTFTNWATNSSAYTTGNIVLRDAAGNNPVGLLTTGGVLYLGKDTVTDFANFSSTGLAVTGNLSATTTGKVGTTIGVGAATPAASGSGITFPATQSASSDANTLDDYEEGTWTPVPVSLTVVGTPTYTGTYTKIGNYVFIIATIQSTTSTAATADTTRFTGLPFTASVIGGVGLSLNTSTSASTAAGQVGGSSATYVTGGWTAAANIRLAAWYQI